MGQGPAIPGRRASSRPSRGSSTAAPPLPPALLRTRVSGGGGGGEAEGRGPRRGRRTPRSEAAPPLPGPEAAAEPAAEPPPRPLGLSLAPPLALDSDSSPLEPPADDGSHSPLRPYLGPRRLPGAGPPRGPSANSLGPISRDLTLDFVYLQQLDSRTSDSLFTSGSLLSLSRSPPPNFSGLEPPKTFDASPPFSSFQDALTPGPSSLRDPNRRPYSSVSSFWTRPQGKGPAPSR